MDDNIIAVSLGNETDKINEIVSANIAVALIIFIAFAYKIGKIYFLIQYVGVILMVT